MATTIVAVKADKNGYVLIPYDLIKGVEDHLRIEHGIPEQCDAIKTLRQLWTKGCDRLCAERQKNA